MNDQKLPSDLSLAVVRLARHLRFRRASSLVSLTQLSALATLDREGPMTPGAMAANERVQPPSMTRVIASLADLGMVTREAHPTDGRQIVVTISERGKQVIADERSAREAWLRERLQELPEADLATMRRAVEIMGDLVTNSD